MSHIFSDDGRHSPSLAQLLAPATDSQAYDSASNNESGEENEMGFNLGKSSKKVSEL